MRVILHELSCLVGEHPLFVFIIKVATIPDKHDRAIGGHILEHFRLVIVIQGNTFSFDYFRFFLERFNKNQFIITYVFSFKYCSAFARSSR